MSHTSVYKLSYDYLLNEKSYNSNISTDVLIVDSTILIYLYKYNIKCKKIVVMNNDITYEKISNIYSSLQAYNIIKKILSDEDLFNAISDYYELSNSLSDRNREYTEYLFNNLDDFGYEFIGEYDDDIDYIYMLTDIFRTIYLIPINVTYKVLYIEAIPNLDHIPIMITDNSVKYPEKLIINYNNRIYEDYGSSYFDFNFIYFLISLFKLPLNYTDIYLINIPSASNLTGSELVDEIMNRIECIQCGGFGNGNISTKKAKLTIITQYNEILKLNLDFNNGHEHDIDDI